MEMDHAATNRPALLGVTQIRHQPQGQRQDRDFVGHDAEEFYDKGDPQFARGAPHDQEFAEETGGGRGWISHGAER